MIEHQFIIHEMKLWVQSAASPPSHESNWLKWFHDITNKFKNKDQNGTLHRPPLVISHYPDRTIPGLGKIKKFILAHNAWSTLVMEVGGQGAKQTMALL